MIDMIENVYRGAKKKEERGLLYKDYRQNRNIDFSRFSVSKVFYFLSMFL
jgi:hypothetical protein